MYTLYRTGKSKDKQYKRLARDEAFVRRFIAVVKFMEQAAGIQDLRASSRLHYERLKYRTESSVRIDNGRVERLIFQETADGIEIELIEIDSNHYGTKR